MASGQLTLSIFSRATPRDAPSRPSDRDDEPNDPSLAIRLRDVKQELDSSTKDYSESRKMLRNKISKKQKNEEDEEHEVCS